MSEKEQSGKKPDYEKPEAREVELAADEVLGVGCKLINGAAGAGDPTSCTTNNCVLDGS